LAQKKAAEEKAAQEQRKAAQEAEQKAPVTSLSVKSRTESYHRLYSYPGETLITIKTTPATETILTYTDTAHEHAVWRLLPSTREDVCRHNKRVQDAIDYGPVTCPAAVEYIEPTLNPPMSDAADEGGEEEGASASSSAIGVVWSCHRHIGTTFSYTVTAQRAEGPPLTYAGRYKNAVTHKWCHYARLKEEREIQQLKRAIQRKREAHERQVRERREKEIAAHRAEEERYERTCRTIGGIPVVIQNREGIWELVCRSGSGGLLEVP